MAGPGTYRELKRGNAGEWVHSFMRLRAGQVQISGPALKGTVKEEEKEEEREEEDFCSVNGFMREKER